jgi:rod shape-determining protein MreC
MESVLGRYRNLIILVAVLFVQVLGLAMQVKRVGNETTHDTRLIRIWVVGAVTPLERGLVWIQNGTHNLWHNYFYLRGVRAENRELKAQIEQMRLEQVRLSEDAAQARRLQNLLSFKEQVVAKTVAAQVIGSSGSDMSRIVYIDKGENAGIARDMAVITADGVVGKVLLVYGSVSQVLLISDQSSGVGAILEKTRLQGVLKGTTNGEVTLERVMADEQVPIGETVLTSGGDQIFPKGLPVGTVAKVVNGKDLFLNIKIKPAANLSKLEEVLVLLEKQEKQATADDKVRVRAADILAQRLPSVPDRPAADASSVGIGTKPALANTPGSNVAAQAPAAAGAPLSAQKPVLTGDPATNAAAPKTANAPLAPAKQKIAAESSNAVKPTTAPAKSADTQKPLNSPQDQPKAPPQADDNSPH